MNDGVFYMTQATAAQSARTFESDLFGSLHVITDTNGAPWFVGRQVAEKLGYGNDNRQVINQAIARHCPDRQNVSEMTTETVVVLPNGVRRNSVLISEGDLYRLVLSSILPSAQDFQGWVVRDILPSIRQHGGFNVEQPTMADQYADPELFHSVNNLHNEFSEYVRTQTAFNTQFAASLANITSIVASNLQPTRELRPMAEGHVTLEALHSEIGGVISLNAFKTLLRNFRWPVGSYERAVESGVIVELPSYPLVAEDRGQVIHINQLIDRVLVEARRDTNFLYSHELINGRFRINR